mmetsp:Transcript_44139/g.124916  ORF Transcript_44139/g.124916 Transcript_44139/m.124916 type:complete len:207 (+) Transcript_44139:385-1005(+)
MCAAGHLKSIPAHQRDRQTLPPMVHDTLMKKCTVFCRAGRWGDAPLRQTAKQGEGLATPTAERLRREGDERVALLPTVGPIFTVLLPLSRRRRGTSWHTAVGAVDGAVVGGGVVGAAWMAHGDVGENALAVHRQKEIHALAVGVGVGWGDAEGAKGHLCDGRNADLRQDGLEDVQQSVVLEKPLGRRLVAEEKVVTQCVDSRPARA